MGLKLKYRGETVKEYLSYAKPFRVQKHDDRSRPWSVRDAEDVGICGTDDEESANLIRNALNAYAG